MFANIGNQPENTLEVVIGLDALFRFMDVTDPNNPTRLNLNLGDQRTLITFRLENKLLAAGWRFQDVPITFDNDWGQNFSSFYWVPYEFESDTKNDVQFKLIYEAKRMGIFIYSLFMKDGLGQPIDLDPKIENGVGH